MNTIKFRNLSFNYKDKEIFHNFNMDFLDNKLYVINGENGSGKSTLCKLLTGIYKNYSGEIFINDIEIKKRSRAEVLNLLHFASQQTPIFSDSLFNNIFLDANINLYQKEKYEKLLKLFKLEELSLKKEINDSTISGGQKQKISILRAYFSYKKIIIFDEPTANLDRESIIIFFNIIEELKINHTIIVVTHDNYLDAIVDIIINI